MKRTLLFLAALAAAGAPPPSPAQVATDGETLTLSREMRLRVVRGREIVLDARPWPGETAAAFAERLSSGEAAARLRRSLPPDPLDSERFVPVPLELLGPELRRFALRTLFPKDRPDGEDWIHLARAGVLPTYDEGLAQVALWFTGSAVHFPELQRTNGLASPELRPETPVRIPGRLLHPAFRGTPGEESHGLVYGEDEHGPYAGYRLRPGEALYSSVVLRFTGRTSREDVETLAAELAKRSGIRDVTDIPVGWLVKIPFDDLESDYLPAGHPRRREAEAVRAAMREELRRTPAPPKSKALAGTVLILDPGHGGKDPGTMHNGLWEHDAVYDVAVRLLRRFERETSATVHLTLVDRETGTEPSKGDGLSRNGAEEIRTHPPFTPGKDGESALGVNLRWYLANSIHRRAVKDGTPDTRVVFVSIHADARHPDLRGLMVYVPGSAYRTRTYGSNSETYRRFREVREKPHVSFDRRERIRSEAVSRELADRIVEAFRKEKLPVQPYGPVRDRIIRGRRDFLPAVLRGNEVPAKVLVEVLNVTNREDAKMLASARERERIAGALFDGIRAYLEGGAP